MSEFDRATAFHEAGHAVAHAVLGSGIIAAEVFERVWHPRVRAWILKNANVQGAAGTCQPRFMLRTLALREHCPVPPSRHPRYYRELVCLYGGPAANLYYWRNVRKRFVDDEEIEELCEGSDDYMRARELAFCMFPHDDVKQEETARTGQDIAARLVRERWAQITAVADVLTKDGVIEGTHPIFRGIKRRRKLPTAVVVSAQMAA